MFSPSKSLSFFFMTTTFDLVTIHVYSSFSLRKYRKSNSDTDRSRFRSRNILKTDSGLICLQLSWNLHSDFKYIRTPHVLFLHSLQELSEQLHPPFKRKDKERFIYIWCFSSTNFATLQIHVEIFNFLYVVFKLDSIFFNFFNEKRSSKKLYDCFGIRKFSWLYSATLSTRYHVSLIIRCVCER